MLKQLKKIDSNGLQVANNALDSDYVSARTRSKSRLATNEVIISKASEEGGDLESSENFAAAFLMLGITESSASALFTFKTAEVESTKIPENEYKPTTYQAALKSPQTEKWKEAMRHEWQPLIENRTFNIVEENQINHLFQCDRDAESAATSPQGQVRSSESEALSPQH